MATINPKREELKSAVGEVINNRIEERKTASNNVMRPVRADKVVDISEVEAKPLPIPTETANVEPIVDETRFVAANTIAQKEKELERLRTERSTGRKKIEELLNPLAGRSEFEEARRDETGLDDISRRIGSIDEKIASRQLTLDNQAIRDQQVLDSFENTGQGVPLGVISAKQTRIGREQARKRNAMTAELNSYIAMREAVQGQYDRAEAAVERQTDLEFADREQKVKNSLQMLDFVGEDIGEEKEELTRLYKEQETQLAEQKESLKEARNLALTALENGASTSEVQRLLQDQELTLDKVIGAVGTYLKTAGTDSGFTLSAGEKRFDAQGNLIAEFGGGNSGGLVFDPVTGDFVIDTSETAGLSTNAMALYTGELDVKDLPQDERAPAVAELNARGLRPNGEARDIQEQDLADRLEKDLADLERLATKPNIDASAGKSQGFLWLKPGVTVQSKEDFLAQMDYFIRNFAFNKLSDLKAEGATFGALSEGEFKAIQSAAEAIAGKVKRDEEGGPITGFTGSEKELRTAVNDIKSNLQKSLQEIRPTRSEKEEAELQSLEEEFGDFNGEASPNARMSRVAPQQTIAPLEKVNTYPSERSSNRLDFNTGTRKVMEAVGITESGGRYDARGPVIQSGMYKGERAMGKYQVMPGNLPEWSRQALGRVVSEQEFMSSPQIQEAIATDQFKRNIKKYGNVEDAVSVWFTGRPLNQLTGNESDGLTTVRGYIDKYHRNINKVLARN